MHSDLIKQLTQAELMDHQGIFDHSAKPIGPALQIVIEKIGRYQGDILRGRFLVKKGQIRMTYWWIYQVIRDYLTYSEHKKDLKGKVTKGKGKKAPITVYLGILPKSCYPTELVSLYSVELDCPSCGDTYCHLPTSIKGDPRGVDLLLRQIVSHLYR